MKEATFNTELVNSLKDQGAWAYKISDSPTSWTAHVTRFTPEKPCDVIGMFHSVGFIIESKQSKKWEAFGKTQLRPSQILNLEEAVAKGNPAFVFLNVRLKAIKAEGQKQMNRLLVFDWSEWRETLRHGTIKAVELKKLPYIEGKGVEGKGIQYNLTGFLGGLVERHRRRTK